MQVPAAALSAEQLSEYVEDGEPTPEYVEIDDEFNLSTYYKPGALLAAQEREGREQGLCVEHQGSGLGLHAHQPDMQGSANLGQGKV
jgi:hypothetical protein